MFGLKSVFETLGYINKESQDNLINLLYLSKCFEKNQLQTDLKAAGFSREEITSIDEQLKDISTHDKTNWANFYQKFSVPFFTSAADDAEKYGKIFNWLNLVTKRILPGANGELTRQHDWLKKAGTNINELTNRVAEVEYEIAKIQLKRKHHHFSAVLVIGGSASQMIASSHSLKSLITFEPLSTSVFYLPHQRDTTYAIDSNAATRFPLIVKHHEVHTEEEFADSLAKKMKKHLHNMKNIYPQADANLPSSQRPSAPPIELPKIDINVIPSFNLNDTHAVLLNFASKYNELLKGKILIISNLNDLQKHKEQAQKVFGEWVHVEAIPAYQNKLEILQSMAARVQCAYDNFSKQQQAQQHSAKSRLPTSTIGKAGLFGAAIIALAGTTYAVASNKETLSEWLPSPFKR